MIQKTYSIIIIGENLKNTEKQKTIQVQEGFKIPNRQDQKRTTPSYTIVKPLSIQNKERILKSTSHI
jgi:hypothetical protein